MELHAILEDSFASQYLLAFAQSELSEEGVCFVLAAHEFKRAVAEFNPVRALELGRKICETHLMPGSDLDINAAVPTQKAATRWLRQYAKDPKASPPVEVIRGAHRIGYRAVAFDVLPRFRQSKFCEELCALHLSRQLSNVARRALRQGLARLLAPVAAGDGGAVRQLQAVPGARLCRPQARRVAQRVRRPGARLRDGGRRRRPGGDGVAHPRLPRAADGAVERRIPRDAARLRHQGVVAQGPPASRGQRGAELVGGRPHRALPRPGAAAAGARARGRRELAALVGPGHMTSHKTQYRCRCTARARGYSVQLPWYL